MRSRIDPMKKIAKTLRVHRELILNYFKAKKQFSSGVVEGLNNKVKVTMRKSYGFRTFRVLEGQRVVLLGVPTRSQRRQLLCQLGDGTGSIVLRFFHFSPAQQSGLVAGARLRCFGEVRRGPSSLEIVHPEYRGVDSAAARIDSSYRCRERSPLASSKAAVALARGRACLSKAAMASPSGAPSASATTSSTRPGRPCARPSNTS